MRSLVSSGTSVDFQDEEFGHTPAIECCFGGFPRILQFLIDHGADINKVNDIGCTPLYCAVQNNSHQCTALLLQNGANAELANIEGTNPLMISAQVNSHQCMSLLLQHGADASRANNSGWSALHFATTYNSYECVSQLLHHRVAVDAIDVNGWTALFLASYQGHLSVVELLVLEGGADFEIADYEGVTARDVASARGHTAVVRFLDIESNWRRRRNYATVLSSIYGAPTDSKMMRVFQCHDVARVIASYL